MPTVRTRRVVKGRHPILAPSHALLAAFAAILAVAGPPATAAIFWTDGRIDYADAEPTERNDLLDATGAVTCADGTSGTAFVVDVSGFVDERPSVYIIATTARVLYEGPSGRSRGLCAFRPASRLDMHLRIGERLVGSRWNRPMDPDDWAFAEVPSAERLPRALHIGFERSAAVAEEGSEALWAVGYAADRQVVAYASGCRPDPGASTPAERHRRGGPGAVMLHDCDVLGRSRGGPLAIRSEGQFVVVALHAGESQERKHGDLRAIPYDPNRNFFNYARRFDEDLENKLIAFISRFAHVRSPSAAIQAQRSLVLSIQRGLTRLGFDAGEIDGLLGSRTREAIRAFQTTLGITPNGRATEELLLLLEAR